MKKVFFVTLLVLIVFSGFSFKAAMVTDLTGLSSSKEAAGFNDIAWWGFEKARDELGVEILLIESREQSDYVSNLRKVAQYGYDMVISVGYLLTDAVNEVAPLYPKVNFVLIDSVANEGPNVASYVFTEEQGSFLAGYLAAKVSKTGVIGFIGGMESPLIKKFEIGYIAGAKYANKDIKVPVIYIGSFDDPAMAREAARILHNQGADVIYHASGNSGIGMIQYAAENNILAIGVDTDQSSLAPTAVVASMVKRVDIATFNAIKSGFFKEFVPGIHVLGINEGAIDLIFNLQCSVSIPEEVKIEIEKMKTQISLEKIKIPSTQEELEKFLKELSLK